MSTACSGTRRRRPRGTPLRRRRAGTGADAGFTLAELVAVVAISSIVLLAAAALVAPLSAASRTVQQRAAAVGQAGVEARALRDLDRQLRSATRVQYVDGGRLRLCSYPSADTATAPARVWLEWASSPSTGTVTVAPVAGGPASSSYAATTVVFTPPAGSPADGVYPAGVRVGATLATTSGAGSASSSMVTTLPRPTPRGACP